MYIMSIMTKYGPIITTHPRYNNARFNRPACMSKP